MKIKKDYDYSYPFKRIAGFGLGVVFFFIMLIMPAPEGMSPLAQKTAAVTLLMVCWWISEALPIFVTALAPLALFPILGIMNGREVAMPYAEDAVFLFLGGFCIAISMQKWNLHRRIALSIIKIIGNKPRQLVLGFMIATAFLSMWISNTATTMMMLPIGMALIAHFCGNEHDQKSKTRFGTALMLGIAYSANIGGIGTLVGTPPNIVFAGQLKILFPHAPEIGFFQWMKVGIPLVCAFIPLTWWYLTFWAFPPERKTGNADTNIIDKELALLGNLNKGEKYTLLVFILTCLAWIFRKDIAMGSLNIPGWSSYFGLDNHVHDSTIAIFAAIILFILPVDLKKREFVLDWESAVKLPWGILLLFGGGFALAKGFMVTGLSDWIGSNMVDLGTLPIVAMIIAICLLITFLTEITSNTATTTMILPILAALSVTLNIHPFALMLPATLSASCAFMLPVATPPNAIIFSSDQVTIPMMAKTGLVLNLFGVALITALIYLAAIPVFGVALSETPAWAMKK
ncbi:SLC13 family permease [Candidatus Kuenenia sp.]|uniref:SLC13 family permease n=1 Tax=Candidatus Kuenenia sp. TaxID=2499824 RepID=UPI0032207C34